MVDSQEAKTLNTGIGMIITHNYWLILNLNKDKETMFLI